MSLLDMINFSLQQFILRLNLLRQEISIAMQRAVADPSNPGALLSDDDRQRVIDNMKAIAKGCEELVLSAACDRIGRIWMALDQPSGLPYALLANELNVLRETIEDELVGIRFYHYPQHKARPLLFMRGEWTATLGAFPSVEKEIERGLDCYGFEDNDGCVFHMMRVAEIGMRALARERKVSFPKHPLEWAEWSDILRETEKRAEAVAAPMSRGPAKDAAVAFYSGAVGQLRAFKDKYRNVIMHVRKSYDELEALQAINQVRDFMNGLSTKIGEKTRTPIRRWP